MNKSIRFVGLDVHKDSIAIAVAEDGRGPAELYGKIPSDWETLRKTLRRLGEGCSLYCCYEAGPCGYGLHRKMRKARIKIVVVVPSLVPKQPPSAQPTQASANTQPSLTHALAPACQASRLLVPFSAP